MSLKKSKDIGIFFLIKGLKFIGKKRVTKQNLLLILELKDCLENITKVY